MDVPPIIQIIFNNVKIINDAITDSKFGDEQDFGYKNLKRLLNSIITLAIKYPLYNNNENNKLTLNNILRADSNTILHYMLIIINILNKYNNIKNITTYRIINHNIKSYKTVMPSFDDTFIEPITTQIKDIPIKNIPKIDISETGNVVKYFLFHKIQLKQLNKVLRKNYPYREL